MLNLDLRVILDNFNVSAGDTLTGTILLAPPRASTSSTATLESLTLTAKCEVQVGFSDSHNDYQGSISHPYLIEKQLINPCSPTELNGETKIRFSLTLPTTTQWSPSLWKESPRFEHRASHAIPGSFEDIIHHSLTVEAKTTSKLFSKSKREVPYHFTPTRCIAHPPQNPRPERQPIRSQPSSSWKRTWETVSNPSHSAGFPATAELKVTLPTQVYIGGPLSITLSPHYHSNHQPGPANALYLKSFSLRLVARKHVRAKLPKPAPGTAHDAEIESTLTEKIALDAADFPDGILTITDGMKLQDLMECNLIESVECAPSFKTYNASLRYALDLRVLVGVGKRQSWLTFRRNLEVLPAVHRRVGGLEVVQRDGELQWLRARGDGECEDGLDGEGEAPPAYSDPPPEYVVSGGSMVEAPRMLVSV